VAAEHLGHLVLRGEQLQQIEPHRVGQSLDGWGIRDSHMFRVLWLSAPQGCCLGRCNFQWRIVLIDGDLALT